MIQEEAAIQITNVLVKWAWKRNFDYLRYQLTGKLPDNSRSERSGSVKSLEGLEKKDRHLFQGKLGNMIAAMNAYREQEIDSDEEEHTQEEGTALIERGIPQTPIRNLDTSNAISDFEDRSQASFHEKNQFSIMGVGITINKKVSDTKIATSYLKPERSAEYESKSLTPGTHSQKPPKYAQTGSRDSYLLAEKRKSSLRRTQYSTQRPEQFRAHEETYIDNSIKGRRRMKGEYMRIGDLIMIYMKHYIYDGGEAMPEIRGLLEQPTSIYKGIIGSDGITSNGLYTLPILTSTNIHSAKVNFIQTIFMIQTPNSYSQALNKLRIEEKIRELNEIYHLEEEEVKELEEQKIKLRKVGGKAIHEEKANEREFQMNLGRIIGYGESIQLKHIFSSKYISLDPINLSEGENGSHQIKLTDGTGALNEHICIVSPNKIGNTGEPISYEATFVLKIGSKNSNYYIHMSENSLVSSRGNFLGRDSEGDPTNSMLEVNASGNPSKFTMYKFSDYNCYLKRESQIFVKSGDIIRLKHIQSNGYLVSTPQNISTLLPRRPKLVNKHDDLEFGSAAPDLGFEISLPKVLILNTDNYLSTCWEIQELVYHKGGKIEWENCYKIKHIASGMFLTMTHGNNQLTLTADSKNPMNQFIFGQNIQDHNSDKNYLQDRSYLSMEHLFMGKVMPSLENINSETQTEFHKNKLKGGIPVLCTKQKRDMANSIFQIEKVEGDTERICRQGSATFQLYLSYYTYLNRWAISFPERGPREGTGKYDHQLALAEEKELERSTNYLSEVNERILRLLEADISSGVQNIFSEHLIIDIILHLLELIEEKSIPSGTRNAMIGKKLLLRKIDSKLKRRLNIGEYTPEYVAYYKLVSMSKQCLKVVKELITRNKKTSTIICNYDVFLSGFIQFHEEEVGELLKEAYRGLCYMNINKESLNPDNVIRWSQLLEAIVYQEEDKNVGDQTLYINIISMLCTDYTEKGVLNYQMQAVREIFSGNSNILQFQFGIDNVSKMPFIIFPRDKVKPIDYFMQQNPILGKYGRQYLTNTVFYIENLSERPEETLPYIEYIAAVLNLYASMFLNRYRFSNHKIENWGLTFDHIFEAIKSPKIHYKFKESYILVLKVFFIEVEPYASIYEERHRCLFWNDIEKINFDSDPLETFYEGKHIRLEAADKKDKNVKEMEIQLKYKREIIFFLTEYVTKHTSNHKRKHHESVTDYQHRIYSILCELLATLKLWKSLIEYSRATKPFIEVTLHLIGLIIQPHDSALNDHDFWGSPFNSSHWVIDILQKARSDSNCKTLIAQIELKTIQILKLILKVRVDLQIYMNMKLFYEWYIEGLPYADIHQIWGTSKFNKLFQLFDFNLQSSYKNILPEKLPFQAEPPLLAEENVDKLIRNQYMKAPLDLYLLQLIFKQDETNNVLKQEVMTILIQNFSQSQLLLDDLIKIDIIVSEEDQKFELEYKKKYEQIVQVKDNIIQNNLYIRSGQNIDKVSMRTKLTEMCNILVMLTKNITICHNSNLLKCQNLLRFLNIHLHLIEILKSVNYDHAQHRQLFKLILVFLYRFVYKNEQNQNLLLKHAKFLLKLGRKKKFKTASLLSQILFSQKGTKYQKTFVSHLLSVLNTPNCYSTNDLSLVLTILKSYAVSEKISDDGIDLCEFIIKNLVKYNKIEESLMFDKEGTKQKQRYLQEYIDGKDRHAKEMLNYHLLMVDLLGTGAKVSQLIVGICRKLVTLDQILQSLYLDTIPYIFKRVYLGFLESTYLTTISQISSVNFNSMHILFRQVIYEDLKRYVLYYDGLLSIKGEEKEYMDIVMSKNETKALLFEESTVQKAKYESNQARELEEDDHLRFIDTGKPKLGDLKVKRFFELDKSAQSEYWDYFSSTKDSDLLPYGLIHFIINFFKSMRLSSDARINLDFSHLITNKIRDVLGQMHDNLFHIASKYREIFKMDQRIHDIIYVLSSAIESVPTEHDFKNGRRTKMVADERGRVIMEEIMDDPNESRMSYGRSAEEMKRAYVRIMEELKDYIIHNELTITNAFNLPNTNCNMFINKMQFKRTLRNILGTEYKYHDIENAITFSDKENKDDKLDLNEWITTLKVMLRRQGYKNYRPKLKGENVANMEFEDLHQDINNSFKINENFQNFIQFYIKCIDLNPERSNEIADFVDKIDLIIQFQLKKYEQEKVKKLIQSLIKCFSQTEHTTYLLDVFAILLRKYIKVIEANTNPQYTQITLKNLKDLQNILTSQGVAAKVIEIITDSSRGLRDKSKGVEILIGLIKYYNSDVQMELLKYFRKCQSTSAFFGFIKEVISSGNAIMRQQINNIKNMNALQDDDDDYQNTENLGNNSPRDLQRLIEERNSVNEHELLVNTLQLLQLFCDNNHPEFQDYLRDQSTGESTKLTISVNLVVEIGRLLIALSEEGNRIFEPTESLILIPQVFETLIDISSSRDNQLLLGAWHRLLLAVNWFLSRKLNWNATSNMQTFKNTLYCNGIEFLRSLLSFESIGIVGDAMLEEVDMELLKRRMIEIYRDKIRYREEIYSRNKSCKHEKLWKSEKVYTCSEVMCEIHHLTIMERRIINAGFQTFIFLTQLKSHPSYKDHCTLTDFGLGAVLDRSTLTQIRHLAKKKKHRAQIFPEEDNYYKDFSGESEDEGGIGEESFSLPIVEGDNGEPIRYSTLGSMQESNPKKPNYFKRLMCCKKQSKKVSVELEEDENSDGQHEELLRDEKYIINNPLQRANTLKIHMKDRPKTEHAFPEMFKSAFQFYAANSTSVEINNYEGKIETVYFQIPSYCGYLSESTKKGVLHICDGGSQQGKMEVFYEHMDIYEAEMKNHQYLARINIVLGWIVKEWKMLANISFILVLLMNLILLFTYEVNGSNSEMDSTLDIQMSRNAPLADLLGILQFAQMLTCLIFWAGYLAHFLPIVQRKGDKLYNSSIDATLLKGALINKYDLMYRKQQSERAIPEYKQKIMRILLYLLNILKDFQFWVNNLYLIFSLLGSIKSELFYSLLLLDIVLRIELLRDIMKVLKKSAFSLIYLFILIMICVYLYSVYAFSHFQNHYISNTDEMNSYCYNLLECFTSTLNNGLRSNGGIGDIIYQPGEDESHYWTRYLFDFSFFLILIIILFTLIFAIIIEGVFSSRSSNYNIQAHLSQNCFICGLNRARFDTDNKWKRWREHIEEEHNAFSYIYFIMYIRDKHTNKTRSIHKYCSKLMKDHDIRFFPIGRALNLQNDPNIPETKFKSALSSIMNLNLNLEKKLDSIQEMLNMSAN